MNKQSSYAPMARAILVITLALLLVSGVTFAALQSQQVVLAGNTITSASADLKISTDNTQYGNSHAGFSFNDVIPGGSPVPATGNSFYLKNSGSTALQLKVSVSTVPTNVSNVDLSKVTIIFTKVPGGVPQNFTLAALISAHVSGGVALADSMTAGSVHNYKVQASLAADAFTGSNASIGNIDFVFTGAAS